MPGPTIDELRALPLPWDDDRFADQIQRVAFSDYARWVMGRYPDAVARIWTTGGFSGKAPEMSMNLANDAGNFADQLRICRHLSLLQILWRDCCGNDDLDQTLQFTSQLADTLINRALDHSMATMDRHGQPVSADGEPAYPLIFGLGKLGGCELNFSSDIDLVYAFTARGETNGRRSISNEEYFVRLFRSLTPLLADTSRHGFCYRVDLRLRPFGDSGRLALSETAMEQYFQREGRDWERYAWIKARSLIDDGHGQRMLDGLKPFIYRRYLDYGAFDALAQMKAMIRAEVSAQDRLDDVKLGSGGIREIEFFVQAHQLLRGGRNRSLRTRSLRGALVAVHELGEISEVDRQTLDQAYVFMRRLENRFQQLDDRQTHVAPDQPLARQQIAVSLGHRDWPSLVDEWDHHRHEVATRFNRVFEPSQIAVADQWQSLWRSGVGEPELWHAPIATFRASTAVRALGERSRQRLNAVVPLLLEELSRHRNETSNIDGLTRLLDLIETIARRGNYLALLERQPDVRARLIEHVLKSRWVAAALKEHPLLLDELILRPAPRDESSGAERLDQQLADAEGDLERSLGVLKATQGSRHLRLALAWLDATMESVTVGESLADLADLLIDRTLDLASQAMVERHGDLPPSARFGIIGYGTLGGREMNFNSDIDLVFLYDGVEADAMSDGSRPLNASRYYVRLAQRLTHLLSTNTGNGALYEVDTRLRPNGKSGMLVSSLAAFANYQREQAWVWERQALSRGRLVAGDTEIGEGFDQIRMNVIADTSEKPSLANEVASMRGKMRAQLDASDGSSFDLKQGPGGRVDIEFLAQYFRLSAAGRIASTGTLESIEDASQIGLIDAEAAGDLVAGYTSIREWETQTALACDPPVVERALIDPSPDRAHTIWTAIFAQVED